MVRSNGRDLAAAQHALARIRAKKTKLEQALADVEVALADAERRVDSFDGADVSVGAQAATATAAGSNTGGN